MLRPVKMLYCKLTVLIQTKISLIISIIVDCFFGLTAINSNFITTVITFYEYTRRVVVIYRSEQLTFKCITHVTLNLFSYILKVYIFNFSIIGQFLHVPPKG